MNKDKIIKALLEDTKNHIMFLKFTVEGEVYVAPTFGEYRNLLVTDEVLSINGKTTTMDLNGLDDAEFVLQTDVFQETNRVAKGVGSDELLSNINDLGLKIFAIVLPRTKVSYNPVVNIVYQIEDKLKVLAHQNVIEKSLLEVDFEKDLEGIPFQIFDIL